ncbi:MAG: HD domain-containing phosphohydrolase [Leptospirales bacterium]
MILTPASKIIIAEANADTRFHLKTICTNLGHSCITTDNGDSAYELALKENADLILLDVLLPGMNGFQLIEQIKKNERVQQIPIIILTQLDRKQDRLLGISKGANDYLGKPFDEEELILRINNNLHLKNYYNLLSDYSKRLEADVENKTKELQKTMAELHKSMEQTRQSYLETVHRLNIAIEYKDKEIGAHTKRIGYYSRGLAEAMGSDRDFCDKIFYASPMHDIGKVAIPDYILTKTEKLSDTEWNLVKSHTAIGAEILEGSSSTLLTMARDICLTHHEKFNGGGYPHNISGEQIPLAGRIVQLADQYDAIRSDRPYKKGQTHEHAVQVLQKGDAKTSPGDFDPDVLNAFIKSEKKIKDIYNEIDTFI